MSLSGYFTNTKNRGYGRCFKAVINLMLREQKKKKNFVPEKNLPHNGFRSFVCRDCAYPNTRCALFFPSNSEREKEREAKRENQKFVCASLYFTIFLPGMLSYQRCNFNVKKSSAFSRNFNYRGFIWRVYCVHERRVVLIASFFSLTIIRIQQ